MALARTPGGSAASATILFRSPGLGDIPDGVLDRFVSEFAPRLGCQAQSLMCFEGRVGTGAASVSFASLRALEKYGAGTMDSDEVELVDFVNSTDLETLGCVHEPGGVQSNPSLEQIFNAKTALKMHLARSLLYLCFHSHAKFTGWLISFPDELTRGGGHVNCRASDGDDGRPDQPSQPSQLGTTAISALHAHMRTCSTNGCAIEMTRENAGGFKFCRVCRIAWFCPDHAGSERLTHQRAEGSAVFSTASKSRKISVAKAAKFMDEFTGTRMVF